MLEYVKKQAKTVVQVMTATLDSLPNNPEKSTTQTKTIGWREWVRLPTLDQAIMKSKIDTGSRTTTLHTYRLEPFQKNNQLWVNFTLSEDDIEEPPREFTLQVVDFRQVIDSSGHLQERHVVESAIELGNHIYEIEIILIQSETSKFRLHLGRTAFQGRYVIDPTLSFELGGKPDEPRKFH